MSDPKQESNRQPLLVMQRSRDQSNYHSCWFSTPYMVKLPDEPLADINDMKGETFYGFQKKKPLP